MAKIRTFSKETLKYLQLLSNQYRNINDASKEIINLSAILNLPKGTEHFISDVHGEFESFNHVLKNASGVIKNKIDEIFGNSMRDQEKRALATLIYYPERKIEYIKNIEDDMADWYRITLFRLVKILKCVSSKYTRSKVRKALPQEFAYIIEELIHEDGDAKNKQMYYKDIIETIIKLDRAENFIVAMSNVIHRLAIDRLHIIGDIYDRGAGAAKIMDVLLTYHSLDIQWGNHDISWMGAAAGNEALICNCIRVTARYAQLDLIEEDYGINLVPLATFAMEHYEDDDCTQFIPKSKSLETSNKELKLIAKMHKAITVLQFKLEGSIIKRNPEFGMNDRLLLDKINFEEKTVAIDGVCYPLNDAHFPTVDPENPYELTAEEYELVNKLKFSFKNSAKLQEHTRLLFSKGSLYSIYNSNLLFHGCIPLNDDGTMKTVTFKDGGFSGKEFFDMLDQAAREGFFNREKAEGKRYGLDIMWYLWKGPYSPLFGKNRMTTFERYFIDDAKSHEEIKNIYYELLNREEVCNKILKEFGLDEKTSHIINGHVPVKVARGESPIKANGKLFVIDGGFAKAYQSVTGIAGYTLIYNSYGLILVSHEPFESADKAIEEEQDILSSMVSLQFSGERIRVGDTDVGRALKKNIKDLEQLLYAYQTGIIKEVE